MRPAPHRVSGVYVSAPTAVDSHLGRPANDFQRDVLARRKHDRTHSERERVHGHEDQVAQRWIVDRPFAGERLYSRTAHRRTPDARLIYHPHPPATTSD